MASSQWFWLPIVGGVFYFLLFAPVGIRKGIFRRQSPEEHFWIKALVLCQRQKFGLS